MRTLFAALTCLMLFTTPLVAGDKTWVDAHEAYFAGDYQKAFQIAKVLAEQGDVMGQLKIGYYYAHGHGVPKDLVYAHAWFTVADAQGYDERYLALLEGDMTKEQISAARKLSFELWEKYVLPFQYD